MSVEMRPRSLARLAVAIGLGAVLSFLGCRGGNSVQSYLSAGDAAMQATNLSKAEEEYKKAVELAPNETRTHVALGNLYVVENKAAAAQTEFMKVLELDPKNAPAHLSLGRLYASQGQLGPAESQYRATVVLDPTKPAYRLALGEILAKRGKSGEAEAQLRTAIGLDPKDAQAHFDLAKLLSTMPNRTTEANAEFAQARALNPKLVLAAPTPAPSATPAASSAPAPEPTIRRINKVFYLTHNSPVYEHPDHSSRVVAHVHRRGYVRVIGVTRGWLQIRLRSGVVGFIPVSAAE